MLLNGSGHETRSFSEPSCLVRLLTAYSFECLSGIQLRVLYLASKSREELSGTFLVKQRREIVELGSYMIWLQKDDEPIKIH